MSDNRLCAVTGVSGFTGKYIARKLIGAGETVINLTGSPEKQTEFGHNVKSYPYSFDCPDDLVSALSGVHTLFITYWIRYPSKTVDFEIAVANSKALIDAAVKSGVKKIVHISIVRPCVESPMGYYRGKAIVEQAILDSGLNYSILRPTMFFGNEGVLINNIAWFLRHLPVFGVAGSGEYQLQPLYVEDLAQIAFECSHNHKNTIMDVVGPEVYTMNELVRLIARVIGSRSLILRMPPLMSLVATTVMGLMIGDVITTPDELKGLMGNMLVSHEIPMGKVALSDWLFENADWLGKHYMYDGRK